MGVKLSIVMAAALPLAVFAKEVDGIAAKVNSDVILRSEVREELRRQEKGDEKFDETLAALIDRRLILKAAADSKMVIQDWVVDGRIREIVDSAFDGNRAKLDEMLRRQKLVFSEWRARLKDDMTASAMRWQTIDRDITVSPGQMRDEYRRHPERYQSEPRVTVSVILLKPQDAAKRQAVDAELRTTPFAEVAKRHSADSRAASGGVWKDVKPEESFKPEICAEIAKMPRGTVSKWIEIDGWSFLLRKDDETLRRRLSLAEAYSEIEAAVRREISAARYREWVERLRAEAFIRICDGHE